jgi:hypothetical protein
MVEETWVEASMTGGDIKDYMQRVRSKVQKACLPYRRIMKTNGFSSCQCFYWEDDHLLYTDEIKTHVNDVTVLHYYYN